MSEMDSTIEVLSQRKTYYVHGSGLFAIPGLRVNEKPRPRSEYHAGEARRAMALVQARFRC